MPPATRCALYLTSAEHERSRGQRVLQWWPRGTAVPCDVARHPVTHRHHCSRQKKCLKPKIARQHPLNSSFRDQQQMELEGRRWSAAGHAGVPGLISARSSCSCPAGPQQLPRTVKARGAGLGSCDENSREGLTNTMGAQVGIGGPSQKRSHW